MLDGRIGGVGRVITIGRGYGAATTARIGLESGASIRGILPKLGIAMKYQYDEWW
jgi:hypothetical protein